MQEQRAAYEAEAKRVEDEFNQKYESFLEGQNEFPRTILLKRQNELKELMQRNMEFNAQARRDLQTAEEEALKPIRAKLNETLASIAREFGFALIINIDSNACPYIDPVMGKDIQEIVDEKVGKENDWHDIPVEQMTEKQLRQAVKDLSAELEQIRRKI